MPSNEPVSNTVIGEEAPLEQTVSSVVPPSRFRRLNIPLIGHLSVQKQQRALFAGFLSSFALLGALGGYSLYYTGHSATLLKTTGDALMESQRMAKSVSAAFLGNKSSVVELKHSIRAMDADTSRLASTGKKAAMDLQGLERTSSSNASMVLNYSRSLTGANDDVREINKLSDSASVNLDTLVSLVQAQRAQALKQGQAAGAVNITPEAVRQVSRLPILVQRIGRMATQFVTVSSGASGVDQRSVFYIAKDLNDLHAIMNALLKGDASRNINKISDPRIMAQVQASQRYVAQIEQTASDLLKSRADLQDAHAAQDSVLKQSTQILSDLRSLQSEFSSVGGLGSFYNLILALLGLFSVVSLALLAKITLDDSNERAEEAHRQREQAQKDEAAQRAINDSNQAAILRLMNELQLISEGDLTQQATVTEDITGAIADSVNYTIEELRGIVAQVKTTADKVRSSSEQAQSQSAELLQSSEKQLHEIRSTGESVLNMAQHITMVSENAQQSADVARQSLDAAGRGMNAVRESIDGMNSLRSQIQDTSKRIKRLGESSQEIGEITELISDLTEQTNVLALNAAIQAASAGEAGRGFSVVAEEVQRLAERSAEATKQISALVRAIQTDTQDAVAAMEKSTQGVVQGAKLSDNAGEALGEIDRVSRELANLIQGIAQQTKDEAESANSVAENIQQIFEVTEQTGAGTRSTAQLVADLTKVAESLRDSVSRFKVA